MADHFLFAFIYLAHLPIIKVSISLYISSETFKFAEGNLFYGTNLLFNF